MIAFERGGLLFVFNFHPTKSFVDYRIGVTKLGTYSLVLSSDRKEFGGFDLVNEKSTQKAQDVPWHELKQSVLVYVPSRVALVFAVKP